MARKIFSFVLIGLGLLIMLFPFVSYDQAYFVGEDYYITMKDSIENQYDPFIEKLIQKERNEKAFEEKRDLYAKVKPYADSLTNELTIATDRKDSTKQADIRKLIAEFEGNKFEKEAAIDEKYDISKLPAEELTKRTENIKKNFSVEDFIASVANEMRNPHKSNKIKAVTPAEIQLKKVNQQDKGPFLLFGFISILVGLFVLGAAENMLQLSSPPVKYGAMAIFFLVAVVFLVKSYNSLQNDIAFQKVYEERELEVREHISLARDLQVSYLESKGKYADSWDKLTDFALKDSIQIIKFLVNKDDTAAVNNALRNGQPLEDTTLISVKEKVFGAEPKFKVEDIRKVPYADGIEYDLETNQFERNGRQINVMLISTKKENFVKNLEIFPENFDNTLLISIGSLAEPTTEGNW